MNHRTQLPLLLALAPICVVVGLLVSRAATADVLPGPELFVGDQIGQDVKLTLSTYGTGVESHNSNSGLELLRHTGEQTAVVFGPKAFADNEIAMIDLLCKQHTVPDAGADPCDDHPEDCTDCDDDGVPECHGSCIERYWIETVDRCVPPGFSVYQLLVPHGFWGESWEDDDEPDDCGQWPIEALDSGDSCLDDDSGCSVSGLGRTNGIGPLAAILLLLVGVGALFMGRKRDSGRHLP